MSMNRHKYKAVKTMVDGTSFSSKLEANVYTYLKQLERAGEVKILDLQPKIYLSKADILFKPDFKIFDKAINKEVYIEAKGVETAVYKIKLRLFKHYASSPLRVYKQSNTLIYMSEEIVPIDCA